MSEGESSKIDRRQFVKLASILGGGVFLAACAPQAAAPTATPAAGAKPAATAAGAAAKPKVAANIQFAATTGGEGVLMIPMFVAQELFLKEEGIDQKATPFAGGGDTIRAITTGGFQLGQAAPSAAVIAFAEGQPIRIIADNLPFPTMLWVVKPDSPLKSMKDLKGKKLGYSRPGSASQTLAYIALRASGLDPEKDVQLVAAGGAPDQMTAVKTGVIDAGFSNDPVATQEVLRKNVRILATTAEFLTNWTDAMIGTSVDYAKSNGDVLAAYLRAHQKAMDFIRTSPDKAAEIWGKGQGIDPEVAKAAIKNYLLEKWSSRIEPANLKAVTEDMIANKQIKEAPPWDKIIDQSFLAPELRTKI